jgi:hypothetical protein
MAPPPRAPDRAANIARWSLIGVFSAIIAVYFLWWRKRDTTRPPSETVASEEAQRPPSDDPPAANTEPVAPPSEPPRTVDTPDVNTPLAVMDVFVPSAPTLAMPDAQVSASDAGIPSRPQIESLRAALAKVQADLARCTQGKGGYAVMSFTFRSDGRAESVRTTTRPYMGTPEGACMEAFARGVTIAPFSQPTWTLAYTVGLGPPTPEFRAGLAGDAATTAP